MKNIAKSNWKVWRKVLSTLCERFPDGVKTKNPPLRFRRGGFFITDLNFRVSLVFGVQDLVRLVAVGEHEIVVIDNVHYGRIRTAANLVFHVRRVQRFCARLL